MPRRRPRHDSSRRPPPTERPRAEPPRFEFELELLPGLEPFAAAELDAVLASDRGSDRTSDRASVEQAPGALRFRYGGPWPPLHALRRAVAVYRLLHFAVPRPKALLGDANLRRLVAALDEVLMRAPAPFRSFRFAAAGADSSVFARLADALAAATGLPFDPDEGDLLLRVRPAAGETREGWEVLARLTPRPLSARAWRACNRPGGLNATLAVVMNDLLEVGPQTRYLNVMCGSGTLPIELALGAGPKRGGAAEISGCDLDGGALECAGENVAAAGLAARIRLFEADATRLPLPDASVDAFAADLPWGDAVGTHEENAQLYPALLGELARVAATGARAALLTHEVRLFERVLRGQGAWRVERVVRVGHGGHHPRVYLLHR